MLSTRPGQNPNRASRLAHLESETGAELNVQDVTQSVLATRNPKVVFRRDVGSPRRIAERTALRSMSQEPPRTTRRLLSPVSHAAPSIGAPL